MADIFVSYSQADRDRVRPLVDALTARGYSVWWDPEGAAGEDLDAMVHREIGEATCIIVVWSATAVQSDWVKGEAEEARQQKKLIPVSIDDSTPPLRFGHGVRPDLSNWDGGADDAEFHQLLRGISGYFPGKASEASVAPAARTETTRRRVLYTSVLVVLIAAVVIGSIWTGDKSSDTGDTPPVVVEELALRTYELSISEIRLPNCQGMAALGIGGKDELCLAMVRNDAFGSAEAILGCDGTEFVCGSSLYANTHAVNRSVELEPGKNTFFAYEEDPEYGICLRRGPADADNRCVEMGKLDFDVDDSGVRVLPGRFELHSHGEQIDPVDIKVKPDRLYEVLFDKTSDGQYRIFWSIARSN